MSALLAVKLGSLFVLLWFGYILLTKAAYRQDAHWLNIATPAAAAVVFVWSMGWLSQ